MSWQASGFVKSLTVSSTGEAITRGEKLVLLLLADYTDPETGIAWPSMETLAEEGLYDRRQILRIIDSLQKKNFVTVERSEGRKTNRYKIVGIVTKCPGSKKSNSDISPPNGDISGSNSDIAMSHEPIEPTKAKPPISLFDDSTDSTIQEPKHSERSKQGSSNCASKTGRGDPRFSPVVAEIFQQYRGFNQGDSPAFTDAAGRQLKMFLKAHSDWTLQKVIMCVRNRFQSDENLSSDPVNWIAHLAKWAGGPLDKFGKPRSLDDGLSKDDKRNRASAIAIARGISNLRKGRGESFVPDRAELPAANYRGDDGIVDEDFEETDP